MKRELFTLGGVTCPSRQTLKCEANLVGAQVQTIAGWPSHGLDYESKCWAGFDSQFDKLMKLHRCQQVKVQGSGLEALASMH
jgi:hypothetical protein